LDQNKAGINPGPRHSALDAKKRPISANTVPRSSPELLTIYEEDGMTLREFDAFTLTEDHAWQEAIWESIADGTRAVRARVSFAEP
jgi:hypothetical protein